MMTSTLQIQMNNARNFIHHNYQRMPSLHRLALLVGTNECTLKKCFKQSFGTTVFGYLFNLRMEMAVQLLCNTDEPVSTIGSSGLRSPKPLLHRLQAQIWRIAIAVSRPAKQGRCKCMTVKRIVRCFANSLNLVSNFIEFGQQFH